MFRQTFASAIITSGYTSTVYTNNPLNSAQFGAQQVPPIMIAGKTYPATVTMTNNGSSSNWTWDSNYALRNVASSAWAISQVALNPGEIVFPGNQKTFGFSVAAPGVAGNYDFRWRMTQAGNGDFGDSTPLTSIGVLPVASANAYSAEYFDDMALTTLSAVRVDASIDFDWGTGAPVAGMGADTFSARWTGDWNFNTSGKYRFTIVANDGIRVWVGGSLALNKWVNVNTATTYTFDKTLAAGVHRVKVEYYENTAAARAKVSWKLR
ncbi:MAG: hypothetical protein HY315_09450 [Acidobacteria bacterium]|nr:hypothetical protein [Acidobacteriota bacterium]